MSARWRYVFGEALAGFVRNPLVTFAVILSSFVSLMTLGLGLSVNRQVELFNDTALQFELSIFLCDGRTCTAITDEQREGLRRDLQADPAVAEVLFESKQQAFDNYQRLFENQPALLVNVTPEVLPASFRVELADPEDFDVVASRFEATPGVDAIVGPNEAIESLVAIADRFQQITFGLAALQLVLTAVLTVVIIRLSMFARREQIAIMRLMGAGNWYVRTPFLLEGTGAALVSAGLAIPALYVLLDLGRGWLIETIPGFPIIDADDALSVAPLIVGVGIAIAVVTSLLSLFAQERNLTS